MQGSVFASSPRGTPSRRGKSPRFSSDSSSHASTSHLGSNYPANSATVFASSLDIRVDGAVPIKDDSSEDTTSKPPAPASGSDKRAPRKSKMDALVALNNQTRALPQHQMTTSLLPISLLNIAVLLLLPFHQLWIWPPSKLSLLATKGAPRQSPPFRPQGLPRILSYYWAVRRSHGIVSSQ